MKHAPIALILALLVAGCTTPSTTTPAPPQGIAAQPPSTKTVTITEVYDGDTYTTDTGDKIRVLGIDTPEIKATAGLTPEQAAAEKCYGLEARDAARTLILNQKVVLTGDPEQGDHDRYGRLLRYVTLTDGTDVAARLINDGYARVYNDYPVAKTPSYRTYQTAAAANHKGGWAPQPQGCGWTP